MPYTAEDLARIAGISRSSVVRRAGIEQFIVGREQAGSAGGRAPVVYSDDAILFLKGAPVKAEQKQSSSGRARRSDRGGTRSLDEGTESLIVERARGLYLAQANPKAVKPAVEHAVRQLLSEERIELGKYASPDDLAWYVYNSRIMRKDKYYQGWYHRLQQGGTWLAQHVATWQKPTDNARYLTQRYDLMEYLLRAGVVGDGFGAGWLRSFDATKFDAWVQIGGQKRTFWYYLMPCALTGYPMIAAPIENEDGESVIQLLVESVRRYGAPLVLQMDNARVNRSESVQSFVRTLWSESELQQFSAHSLAWFDDLFGRSEPYIFNLPNIPRYPMKAKNERAFRQIADEYIQIAHAQSYTGGTREAGVHLTLSNRPDPAIEAPPGIEVWRQFEDWLYSTYIRRNRPDSLGTFHRLTGLPPTIEAAWSYFSSSRQWRPVPAEREGAFLYWSVPSSWRHVRKAGRGYVAVQHDGTQRNYVCAGLSQAYEGRPVTVVPVPDAEHVAHVFYQEGEVVSYVGIAYDSWARTPGQVSAQRERVQAVRSTLQREAREAAASVEEAEWRVIDGEPALPDANTVSLPHVVVPSAPIPSVEEGSAEGGGRSPELERLRRSL